jgi:hypothetical protein
MKNSKKLEAPKPRSPEAPKSRRAGGGKGEPEVPPNLRQIEKNIKNRRE